MASNEQLRMATECNMDINNFLCLHSSLVCLEPTRLIKMARERAIITEDKSNEEIAFLICKTQEIPNMNDARAYMIEILSFVYDIGNLNHMTTFDLFKSYMFILERANYRLKRKK